MQAGLRCVLVPLTIFFLACLIRDTSARQAFVTFVASDDYAVGARALGASLRATGTTKEMVALTLHQVSVDQRRRLKDDGWRVMTMPLFPNPFDDDHYTFTKMALWSLTEYKTLVFLDADCVVRTNIDEVFQCGEVLCAGMGRHESRKFDFDMGLLVLHPSKPVFEAVITSAERLAKTKPETEFDFLNHLFKTWCQTGEHPTNVPSTFTGDGPYEPPVWEPGMRTYQRCFQLDARYNWQWGSDAGDSLLGTGMRESSFHSGVRVLHFAGRNVKPWHWLNYPMHGWISEWHTYAALVPDLYPISWYLAHALAPFIVLMLALATALNPGLPTAIVAPQRVIKLAFHASRWPCFGLPPVAAKLATIWLMGGVPLFVAPVVLYRLSAAGWVLPSTLSPVVGWTLFFAWSSLLYWAVYGPYVLYHYLLGCAVAALPADRTVKLLLPGQMPWLRRAPSFVPRAAPVLAACVIHSILFALLGNLLILFESRNLAWSSAWLHLFYAIGYALLVLPVFFALWGAGLPRHAFLMGYRSVAPASGQGAFDSVEAGLSKRE